MPLQLPLLLLPPLPLLNLSGRNYLNDVILDSIACPEITPCAFIIRSCRPSHEMKMRRLDKLIQHPLSLSPYTAFPLSLPCYALIWHAVHVERKLFRKALFMLRHKFNANKEAQAAAPRSRPHTRLSLSLSLSLPVPHSLRAPKGCAKVRSRNLFDCSSIFISLFAFRCCT